MKLIDFDTRFSSYLNEWMQENRSCFQHAEEMEEKIPEVYQNFLEEPAPWLDGAAPGVYFDRYTDGEELCRMMNEYTINHIPIPDPLLSRLADIGDEAAFLALVRDEKASCEARMHAVDLLREMESKAPMVDYIRWQAEGGRDRELLDNALESLRDMGRSVQKAVKIAFLAAEKEGKEALLDVLCDFPPDDDAFAYALRCFQEQKEKRGLFAGYLAKLGDDRALETLLDAADSEDMEYIDFIEVRSAIERLGGEAPVRDFSKDPTYQAIQRLQ